MEHLSGADPVLRRLIRSVGPCRFRPHDDGHYFEHLARAIVYQQLSGKAAATIYGRVLEIYGGTFPEPDRVAATKDALLRAAGLSRQKLSYMKDLAAKVGSGDVQLDHLDDLDDEAVIESLVRVKGIGRWTAQMFLMFRLGRPDVLPTADLGIQKAIQKAYALRGLPDPRKITKIGEAWRPYRTIACWYLWRSLDGA